MVDSIFECISLQFLERPFVVFILSLVDVGLGLLKLAARKLFDGSDVVQEDVSSSSHCHTLPPTPKVPSSPRNSNQDGRSSYHTFG